MWLRTLLSILLAALVLASVGCSAPGLVYDRLDWLSALRVRHYVQLEDTQSAEFRQGFAEAWAWHRRSELPLYAREIRGIAEALDQPVTAGQVHQRWEQAEQDWQRSATKLLDGVCPVLRSLRDDQVKEILETMDEDNADFARKFVEPPPEKRLRNSRDRTRKWLEHWTGDFNPQQMVLLERWAASRDDLGQNWLALRKLTRQRWSEAFSIRTKSAHCDAFRPLVAESPTDFNENFSRAAARNQQQMEQFVADVIGAMDAEQRVHTQEKLRSFADDLSQLSRKKT